MTGAPSPHRHSVLKSTVDRISPQLTVSCVYIVGRQRDLGPSVPLSQHGSMKPLGESKLASPCYPCNHCASLGPSLEFISSFHPAEPVTATWWVGPSSDPGRPRTFGRFQILKSSFTARIHLFFALHWPESPPVQRTSLGMDVLGTGLVFIVMGVDQRSAEQP